MKNIKKFVKDHPIEIIYGTVTAVILGVYVTTVIKTVKDTNATIDTINSWITEETEAGKVVVQLIDGSFMSITPEN